MVAGDAPEESQAFKLVIENRPNKALEITEGLVFFDCFGTDPFQQAAGLAVPTNAHALTRRNLVCRLFQGCTMGANATEDPLDEGGLETFLHPGEEVLYLLPIIFLGYAVLLRNAARPSAAPLRATSRPDGYSQPCREQPHGI